MNKMRIGKREIGEGHPTYLVAEMSANHGHSLENAIKTIRAAKDAGADAIKIQTYTPETMTIASSEKPFQIAGGTLWDGKSLYELYAEAQTPWEWHAKLKATAEEAGLEFFSTAFDVTAVDFLENLNVPVHKVASFELVDLALIKRMARTGKPLILSTGMATTDEVQDAIGAAKGAGAREILLLKCTSAYPAPPEDANLRTMADMKKRFGVEIGLSDHTLGIAVPLTAVAMGACLIEKHFTLSRKDPSPDSAFSLEPAEFRQMTEAVRVAEKALGEVKYGPTGQQVASLAFRRSLYVVEDVSAGEIFSEKNVRSIRPGYGLPPKCLEEVIGKTAVVDIKRGTALSRKHFE